MTQSIPLNIKCIYKPIIHYFKTWWLPIATYLIPMGLFILSTQLKSDLLYKMSVYIVLAVIGVNLFASLVQLSCKHWFKALLQLAIALMMYSQTTFITTWVAPDYYGAHKTIPEGIEIFAPIDIYPSLPYDIPDDFDTSGLIKSIHATHAVSTDLILIHDSQPGIYRYLTDYQPDKTGYFFIKAYEITSNDRLSKNRMDYQSKIEVTDSTASAHLGKFTIYEGSWGDKYGARVELWYQPDMGEAYQVTQKNYIVEGWMR